MQEIESRNSIIWTLDAICCKFAALEENMLTVLSKCEQVNHTYYANQARSYLGVLGLEINNLADTLGINLSVNGDARTADVCYGCRQAQEQEYDTAPLEVVSSRDYLFR